MGLLSPVFNFVVRVLFTGHAFLCIWTMVNVHSESRYWYNLLVFGALLSLEGWITFKANKSGGWKWFCPSVFLYIVNTVPYIWMLEVNLFERRQPDREMDPMQCDFSRPDNQTLTLKLDLLNVNFQVLMGITEWTLMLEYTLLLLLIVARWLLPKGEISRDQLSQLLLVFIGIASDILEFITEGIRTEEISCDFTMVSLILAVWAWSLIQFALTLTVTGTSDTLNSKRPRSNCYALCCGSEVWAIAITVLVQDGPYFAVRLYIMIEYQVTNQLMLFFTTKNALVLLLQVYRVAVVCTNHRKRKADMEFDDSELKAVFDDKQRASVSYPIQSYTPSPYNSPYPSPFQSPYHISRNPSPPLPGDNNEIVIPVSAVGSGSLTEDENNGSIWLEPNQGFKKKRGNLEKWPAMDTLELRDQDQLLNSLTPPGSLRSLNTMHAYENHAFTSMRSGSF